MTDDDLSLQRDIDARIGEVRTDTFDLSFGEIANLHSSQELIIAPEYQRLFRWSPFQKSHLVESLLLQLPVPQIFVVENEDGVLELIDGLQRISSVLQFIMPDAIDLAPLRLEGCSLIPGLNGRTFDDLPLALRLRLKRSPIRTVVIKRQSQTFLRYEMFKRLNTGGSMLEPQEIRNCSSRMFGDEGVRFYAFLVHLAASSDFRECMDYLPQAELEKKGDEELVLRFFALKNAQDSFRGSVRDWLDGYMESVLKKEVDFDMKEQGGAFRMAMGVIRSKLGSAAFVRHREGKPVGGVAPAFYEAITQAFAANADLARAKSAESLRNAVNETIESAEFREVTGPGANNKTKLGRRIALIAQAIENAEA